jgi:hypothetical protein
MLSLIVVYFLYYYVGIANFIENIRRLQAIPAGALKNNPLDTPDPGGTALTPR